MDTLEFNTWNHGAQNHWPKFMFKIKWTNFKTLCVPSPLSPDSKEKSKKGKTKFIVCFLTVWLVTSLCCGDRAGPVCIRKNKLQRLSIYVEVNLSHHLFLEKICCTSEGMAIDAGPLIKKCIIFVLRTHSFLLYICHFMILLEVKY